MPIPNAVVLFFLFFTFLVVGGSFEIQNFVCLNHCYITWAQLSARFVGSKPAMEAVVKSWKYPKTGSRIDLRTLPEHQG
jgi:hypothetical protein